MSTISGLSRIRNKVEEELDTSFILHLIEKAIVRHAGKGLRDCDCDFCQAKRRGTRDISNCVPSIMSLRFGNNYIFGDGEEACMLPPSDDIGEAWENFKQRTRNKQRVKLREALAKLKKEIL